ncbi:MAG: hypothetical protein L0271_09825, partial [Gemmatimonadetes bacterium]|nr:hypothetical protein [Gemmatimonadota bacterium]
MLFAVNQGTGNRTVLSDFSDPAQGVVAYLLHGVAIDPAGNIWAMSGNLTNSRVGGALFRVDGATGQRQLISDFGDAAQGPIAGTTFRVISDGSR